MRVLFLAASLCLAGYSPECPVEEIGSYLYQPSYCMDCNFRGPAEPYVPQPGDIMLATDRNKVGNITHDLALAFQPHGSAIVFARRDGSLAIIEAGPTDPMHRKPEEELTFLERLARREGTNDTMFISTMDVLEHLSDYETKGPVWIRRRKTPLTEEESCRLTEFAEMQDGKRFALGKLGVQLTPFRTRGPVRTYFVGKPNPNRKKYYCSELVSEACVYAGLIDAADARPSATYPHDLFVERSPNLFLRRRFHLDCDWFPPARWTSCPEADTPDNQHCICPKRLIRNGRKATD